MPGDTEDRRGFWETGSDGGKAKVKQQAPDGVGIPAQDPCASLSCFLPDASLLPSKPTPPLGLPDGGWLLLWEAGHTGLSSLAFSAPGWSHGLAIELVPNKLSRMLRKALLVPWDSLQKADWVAT